MSVPNRNIQLAMDEWFRIFCSFSNPFTHVCVEFTHNVAYFFTFLQMQEVIQPAADDVNTIITEVMHTD